MSRDYHVIRTVCEPGFKIKDIKELNFTLLSRDADIVRAWLKDKRY